MNTNTEEATIFEKSMIRAGQKLQNMFRARDVLSRVANRATFSTPATPEIGAVVAPTGMGKTRYIKVWGSSCDYLLDGDHIPVVQQLYAALTAKCGNFWWEHSECRIQKDNTMMDLLVSGQLKTSINKSYTDRGLTPPEKVIILSAESLFLALPVSAMVTADIDDYAALLRDRRERGLLEQPHDPERGSSTIAHYNQIAEGAGTQAFNLSKDRQAFTTAVTWVKRGLHMCVR